MMTKDSNSVSTTTPSVSNDGRGRSYRPELGAAFEDRLGAVQQRLNRDDTNTEKKDEEKSEKRADKDDRARGASDPQRNAKVMRQADDQEQQGQDGRAPFEGLVQLAPAPLRGLEMVVPVSAVSGLDPALMAQLERIAAAIAENLPRQVDKQMTVSFGKGDFAQGAILTRDASGAISVHIAGLHPGVTAAQSVRLQQELRARLMAKKLEVREVAFAEAAPQGHQPKDHAARQG